MKITKKFVDEANTISKLQAAMLSQSITYDELLSLIHHQPQNVSYWKFLHDNYSPQSIDSLLLSHPKNYIAWAYKKRFPSTENDEDLLKKILEKDSKNFHAWNYIIWRKGDQQQPIDEQQQLKLREKQLNQINFSINDLALWDSTNASLPAIKQICEDNLEPDDFGPYIAFAKKVLKDSILEERPQALKYLSKITQPHILYLAKFLTEEINEMSSL